MLSEITKTLSEFIDTLGFRNVLQASDVLNVAHNVAGVDSIRFLTDVDDSAHFAIERVSSAGTLRYRYASTTTPKRAVDVKLGDGEIAVLDQVVLKVRAQNSFGTV